MPKRGHYSQRMTASGIAIPVLFSLLCIMAYVHGSRSRAIKLSELSFRLQELKKEQILAIQERDGLLQRLQSESDPAWIEMLLMKELGVVPEGWVKVRFVEPVSFATGSVYTN